MRILEKIEAMKPYETCKREQFELTILMRTLNLADRAFGAALNPLTDLLPDSRMGKTGK